jgi:hypothetical protein
MDEMDEATAGAERVRESLTVFLLLLVCLTMTLFVKPDADADIWARLAVGKLFFETGGICRQDVFAYTPTKPVWVDHEWGSSVVFYSVARAFGQPGLLLLKALLFFGTVLAIYLAIRQRTGRRASLFFHIFVAYAVFFYGFKVTLRCQAFTFFFFALWLYCLERMRAGHKTAWWVLPPTMILWANLHGGFLAGLGLVGLYAGGELLNRRPWKAYLPLGALCAAVTLANPYGLRYWSYMFQATTMPRALITEWQPVQLLGPLGFLFGFKILFAVTGVLLVAHALSRTRPDWVDVLVIAVTGVLALRVIRHTPFFAIGCAPFVYVTLRRAAQEAADKWGWAAAAARAFRGPQLRVLYQGGTRGLLLLACALVILSAPWRITMAPGSFPVAAIEFIRANGLRGNLLAPFNWGSYAIWALYPQCRVSVDGRYEEAYPESTFLEMVRVFDGEPGWEQTLAKYPHDLILVWRYSPLQARLRKRPDGWVPAYDDPVATVFVRAEARRAWRAPDPQSLGRDLYASDGNGPYAGPKGGAPR